MGLKLFFLRLLTVGTVLGLLLGITLLAALHALALSPDLLLKRLESLPRQRTELITPKLSSEQWAWVRQHWRDRALYIIVDREGRAWLVGMGIYPKPVRLGSVRPMDPAPQPPPPCAILNATGIKPAIALSGQVGGAQHTPVTWYIAQNYYWNESSAGVTLNWSIVERIDFWAGWLSQYPSCSFYAENPVSISDIDVNDTSFWVIPYGEGYSDAAIIDNELPEAGTYYFAYAVRLYLSDGREYVRIYYVKATVGTGDSPPRNPVARALYTIGAWIKSALARAGKAVVQALQAVLPEELKQLLSSVWSVFSTVFDVFKATVQYMVGFAEFFKLLAYMIPLIVVAITLVNPLAVPQFLMELFDMMRRVVQFIRSLLPI